MSIKRNTSNSIINGKGIENNIWLAHDRAMSPLRLMYPETVTTSEAYASTGNC